MVKCFYQFDDDYDDDDVSFTINKIDIIDIYWNKFVSLWFKTAPISIKNISNIHLN